MLGDRDGPGDREAAAALAADVAGRYRDLGISRSGASPSPGPLSSRPASRCDDAGPWVTRAAQPDPVGGDASSPARGADAGPARVPDTGGRYYVLQFVDAWTNNFAYVGHRATGTRAGSFLLAPPGDEHTAGDEAPVIRPPTTVASIVGRWAVDGADDLPAVQALEAGLTLTPLGGGGGRGLPAPDPILRMYEPDAAVFDGSYELRRSPGGADLRDRRWWSPSSPSPCP
jgi:hypothetical protein